MSSKLKSYFHCIVIFLFVFVIPNLLYFYHSNNLSETYYDRTIRNYNVCLERAKRDALEKDWCSEINSASDLAFNSATQVSDVFFLMLIYQPVLFVLIMGLKNLSEKNKE